jgi:diguanylate cyclase (GGDEF)-like protein/PAS domain S-box-containing protein
MKKTIKYLNGFRVKEISIVLFALLLSSVLYWFGSSIKQQIMLIISWGLILIPLIILFAGWIIYTTINSNVINHRLRKAHADLDFLLNATPDAMLFVDAEGHIIRSNHEAVSLFGYSNEQFLGMTVEELLPVRLRGGHVGLRKSGFAQPSSRSMKSKTEFSILTQDGRELPVEISLSFMMQSGRNIAITSIRDIAEKRQAETALQNSMSMLNKAQEISHMGSWDWQIQENNLFWSDEIFRILGLAPQQFTATCEGYLEYVHPDDRARVQALVEKTLVGAQSYKIEHRVITPEGQEKIVLEVTEVYRDDSGEPVRMVGMVQDITERKSAEAKLQLAKKVFDNTLEAILILDVNIKVVDCNTSFNALTGYGRKELLGQNPFMLSFGRHTDNSLKDIEEVVFQNEFWKGEIWNRHKDGELYPCLASMSSVKNSEGRVVHYVMVLLDISSMKQDQQRLEKMANFDQLTGLANRFLFGDRLHSALSRAHRNNNHMAVLYIDLDGFKQVNDNLGHQQGDELLITISRKLNQCVREDDTVARLGGDEFAIILNEQPERSGVIMLVERILKVVAIRVPSADQSYLVTASIGIALYPQDGDDSKTLIRHADQAMYHAKNQGKNTYHFFGEI